MKAEILSVGTELLLGDIVNTDAQFLARELARLGFTVLYHSTVGDNEERLSDLLQTALSRSDLVLTTGGLGPTADDLTKEVCAKVLGIPLVEDAESMRRMEFFFPGPRAGDAGDEPQAGVSASGLCCVSQRSRHRARLRSGEGREDRDQPARPAA